MPDNYKIVVNNPPSYSVKVYNASSASIQPPENTSTSEILIIEDTNNYDDYYQLTVEELDFIITDNESNSTLTVIRLPKASEVLSAKKSARFLSSRTQYDESSFTNQIVILPHEDDSDAISQLMVSPPLSIFLVGQYGARWSLYNNYAGSYIELIPFSVGEGVFQWKALSFTGFWEDRD
jgi:hypothetical protein